MQEVEFVDWLRQELQKRGWSQNELARRARLTSAGVSLVMTGDRNPGQEFCQAIAKALKIPAVEVFHKAGLLDDPISELFAGLNPEQREIILVQMRRMVEENERTTAKAGLHPATTRI